MKNRGLSAVSILALWLVIPAVGLAQQPSTPGPEHAFLKEHAGTWDCNVKAGPEDAKGQMVCKMVAGGLWMTSEFTGEFGGQKFEGRGLDGFDQDKKKYVSVWVDSMTSSLMTFEGTYDEKAKRMTMIGEGKGPDGQPAKYKTTTDFPDADKQIFKMFLAGADGNDTLMMTIEYTRRK
jgi:hypothetical protein